MYFPVFYSLQLNLPVSYEQTEKLFVWATATK
jgi:hypothetical protein